MTQIEQIEKIELLLGDALLALGTGNCSVNQCEGCKVDEEFAKNDIKEALKIIYKLKERENK